MSETLKGKILNRLEALMGRLSDDYWNDHHSQQVKKEVLQNDRDCMMTRQQNALDESGGRFAKVTPTSVTGASPPEYPRQPATFPWSHDPVPPGDAIDKIDYDPNFVEPIEQPTPILDHSPDVGSAVGDDGPTESGVPAPSSLSVTNSHAAAASFQVADAVAAVTGGVSLSSSVTPRKRSFRRF